MLRRSGGRRREESGDNEVGGTASFQLSRKRCFKFITPLFEHANINLQLEVSRAQLRRELHSRRRRGLRSALCAPDPSTRPRDVNHEAVPTCCDTPQVCRSKASDSPKTSWLALHNRSVYIMVYTGTFRCALRQTFYLKYPSSIQLRVRYRCNGTWDRGRKGGISWHSPESE